jgi:hypothetical protein
MAFKSRDDSTITFFSRKVVDPCLNERIERVFDQSNIVNCSILNAILVKENQF